MKQNLLLIASLAIGISAQAQFLETNAPVINDNVHLYAIDSLNAPTYENVTGVGVTWDYSSYKGYENETRDINIDDGSTSTDFPTSQKAQVFDGPLTTYYTDDANSRISQGMYLDLPGIGTSVVKFDVDEEKLYEYPFNVGDAFVDNFEGNFLGDFNSTPISGLVTGTVDATVDGEGTLILADNSYSNVLRYKLKDVVLVEGLPIVGDIEMTRTQYEYYDLSVQSLPIFIHSVVLVSQVSDGAELQKEILVLSIEEPHEYVGLATNVLGKTSVYPNPTEEVLNIELPSSVKSADIDITDALGRHVLNNKMQSGMKAIDVSLLNRGVYFIHISDGAESATKRIVIQ